MVNLCPVCSHQISGASVTVDNKVLHTKCFFCSKCAKQCRITNFKIENGKYSCIDCSNRQVVVSGSSKSDRGEDICPVCVAPVTGGSVSVESKLLHQKCFFCAKCAKQLRTTNFKTENGKYYCTDCGNRQVVVTNTKKPAAKVEGEMCAVCSLPIPTGAIQADDKFLHPKCFFCAKCTKTCKTDNFSTENGKFYCGECTAKKASKPATAAAAPAAAAAQSSPRAEKDAALQSKTVGGVETKEDLCPVCGFHVSGASVVVNDKKHHPKCFFCKKCAKACRLGHFQLIDRQFYCQDCVDKTPTLYHAVRNASKTGELPTLEETKDPNDSKKSAVSSSSAGHGKKKVAEKKKGGGCLIM